MVVVRGVRSVNPPRAASPRLNLVWDAVRVHVGMESGPGTQRQSAQSPPRVKVNCFNAVLDMGNERVRGGYAPTLEVPGALLVVMGYVLRGVHPVHVPSGVLLPGALPFTGASNPAPPQKAA